MRTHRLLIPLAALVAVLPLLVHGPSCGHDFDFHLLNWVEAAHQLAHAHYPRWAFRAAYGAGEPRFLFYPPLSWLLGAALATVLPLTAVPAAYTFCCLTLSGFSLYRLASRFSSPAAATLSSILYLLNPYSLFTAYERTAYAELLAAAVLPLLFSSILTPRPTVRGLALPLALVWLTNAPAAVMGTYALALLAGLRLALWTGDPPGSQLNAAPVTRTRLLFARTAVAGTALGLLLPAFYLLPAAYERRWVTIALAVTEGMRPGDNWLFHHTADPAHDAVLHTASVLAVLLLTTTLVALALALRSVGRRSSERRYSLSVVGSLLVLTLAVASLLTPLSAPVWGFLPELSFLQFPWRTLALVAVALALAVAIALRDLRLGPSALAGVGLLLAVALVFHPYPGRDADTPRLLPQFVQGCDAEELPPAPGKLPALFAREPPTDEYTPAAADNDSLHPGDPAWWLLAPDRTPNHTPDLTPDRAGDEPTPPGGTPAGAPADLTVSLSRPSVLVLNRRVYPAWQARVNGRAAATLDRADGLFALPLPVGTSHVDLLARETPDRLLGDALSLVAWWLWLLAGRHRRPVQTPPAAA